MAQYKIAWLSASEPNRKPVEEQLAGLDYKLEVHIPTSEGEVIEAIKGADVIINQAIAMPSAVIKGIDKAQAIVIFGQGFDRIDVDSATKRGVMLVNSAGFCTEEVSNHVIMMLLACSKQLTVLNDLVKRDGWGPKTRSQLMGSDPIDGQTLGLVGFGNIGRATARKAQVFGLETIVYDPFVQPWIVKEYRVEQVVNLEELAHRSDFVSLHVPLNDGTKKLIRESFFKAMKSTAYLINTCRGPTVDEAALIRALQSGEIAGAGLDVFEQEPINHNNPLLSMENVLVSPHTAGFSNMARATATMQVGKETARILTGTWPMSLVNQEVRSKFADRPPATSI